MDTCGEVAHVGSRGADQVLPEGKLKLEPLDQVTGEFYGF